MFVVSQAKEKSRLLCSLWKWKYSSKKYSYLKLEKLLRIIFRLKYLFKFHIFFSFFCRWKWLVVACSIIFTNKIMQKWLNSWDWVWQAIKIWRHHHQKFQMVVEVKAPIIQMVCIQTIFFFLNPSELNLNSIFVYHSRVHNVCEFASILQRLWACILCSYEINTDKTWMPLQIIGLSGKHTHTQTLFFTSHSYIWKKINTFRLWI